MKKRHFLNALYILFLTLVILSFVFLILGIGKRDVDYSFNDDKIVNWCENWTVRVGGAVPQQTDLPIKLGSEYGAVIKMSKILPDEMEGFNCLMLESRRQDMYVYVGDSLRDSYNDGGQRIGNSLPHAYLLVPLYNTDAGKEVRIINTSATYYSGNLNKIYLGDERSIILTLIKANIVWMALITVIFIIGVICLICYVVYRKTFEHSSQFLFLFWFSLFTAIWCLTQIKVRQMFVGDIVLLESLGHCGFLLIPIPIMLLFNVATKLRHNGLIQIGLVISMINFLGQNILHTGMGVDYFVMQNITQLYTLMILLLFIGICFRDMKKGVYSGSGYLVAGLFGHIFGIVAEAICIGVNYSYTMGSHYIMGALIFLICILIDIFVDVRKEQLKKKDAELSNQAKSRFLATMSHEIRTPINVVLGMNEMIWRESTEPVVREYSANIEEAGKSLLSLVNDVLDFSKIESGKMDILCVEYRMKSVLNDLIMMTKSRIAEKKIKLISNIDETIPSKYYGDEVRIKQVVTNLLTNAAKYTQAGSITFTVKNMGITDDTIELLFSVKDTGMGIKPEDLELLQSSAFVRVDEIKNRNIEGTGLGLAITRQLLNLMDSELKINSEYGVGSDFYFVIKQKIVDKTPMGSIQNREIKEKKRVNTFTATGARLLAVDDTKTNLTVIKGLLKPYGMTVDTAVSGMQCLELCSKQHYDIIFMDHMMPEMDGVETLQKLREGKYGCETTRVVALTANAISGAEQIYREKGFDGYLTKPINTSELDICVKNNLPEHLIQSVNDSDR